MSAWVVRTLGALALASVACAPAMAERTAAQEVACAQGADLRLASDGTVSACRIEAAADLLVAPGAGNAMAACAAGAQVEFHRNGYLSFCNPSGPAATYVGRSGRATRCQAGSRLAFDEKGLLEYCS